MDMAYMGAGKVPRPYVEQLSKLAEFKKVYPQLLPFIIIDPRREGVMDLLQKCVEEWGYRGVKLYPPLRYFPHDERLYPVYQYCQKNGLPIIAHCSPYNPIHFYGKKKELLKLLSKSDNPIVTKGKNRKELCSYFTHPHNYKKVLDDFKDLKICLAHFGSEYFWKKYLDEPEEEDNWFVIIKDMISGYSNLYSNISFTLNNQEFYHLLKVLLSDELMKRKVLFGSDYYMVETKSIERRFGLDLRAFVGEENFFTIATENPNKFLSGTIK